MEKFQPKSAELPLPGVAGSVLRSRSLLRSLALIGSLTASACAHMPSMEAQSANQLAEHAKEQEKRKADPYGRLRGDFHHDLSQGTLAEDSPLSAPPMLYYSDPEHSTTLQLAELLMKEVKDNGRRAREREVMNEELGQASQSGVTAQDAMRQAYYNNAVPILQIKQHGARLEAKAVAILDAIKGLVQIEAQAAAISNEGATHQHQTEEPSDIVPLVDKDPSLSARHASKFRNYGWEKWIQPHPFQCDWVTESTADEPSNLLQPEAAKTLLELAQLHRDAAIQRAQAYGALQAYAKLRGTAPQVNEEVQKLNAQLLSGWAELIREERVEGKGGALREFIAESVLVARLELQYGESLGRCSDSAIELEGEDHTPSAPTPTTLPTSTPPTTAATTQASETTGDFYNFQTDASVATQLNQLDQALKATDFEILSAIALSLEGPAHEAEIQQLIQAYESAPDDLRKLAAKNNLVSSVKFLLSLRENRSKIADIAKAMGVTLSPAQ